MKLLFVALLMMFGFSGEVFATKDFEFINEGGRPFMYRHPNDFEPKIDIHPYIKSIVQFKTGESVRFSHFGEDSALYPAVNFVVSE